MILYLPELNIITNVEWIESKYKPAKIMLHLNDDEQIELPAHFSEKGANAAIRLIAEALAKGHGICEVDSRSLLDVVSE